MKSMMAKALQFVDKQKLLNKAAKKLAKPL